MNNINRNILLGGASNPKEVKYFAIEALEDGLTAKLINTTGTCEYSLDGNTWNTLSANTYTPAVNTGSKIYFRGNLTPTSSRGIGTFNISKKCNVKGNIMSLLYGDNFEEQKSLTGKSYAFYKLFETCSNIINANKLILPATTLADSCYHSMFRNCISLTEAPKLPANTLAYACYQNMFAECSKLTNAPELSATTLADYCYCGLFRECISLKKAPILKVLNLKLGCYYNMFINCRSLTEAPELPATTLANNCYYYMFAGCNNLNNITMLATNISASNCLSNWVSSVASSGTFIKNAAMTSLPSGASGIPAGWTVQDYEN